MIVYSIHTHSKSLWCAPETVKYRLAECVLCSKRCYNAVKNKHRNEKIPTASRELPVEPHRSGSLTATCPAPSAPCGRDGGLQGAPGACTSLWMQAACLHVLPSSPHGGTFLIPASRCRRQCTEMRRWTQRDTTCPACLLGELTARKVTPLSRTSSLGTGPLALRTHTMHSFCTLRPSPKAQE